MFYISLAAYFASAALFNVVSTFRPRPFTINSKDPAEAKKNTVVLLLVGILEGISLQGWWPLWLHATLYGVIFPAVLLSNGVFLHTLVPYRSGTLVLEQGRTTPPVWVEFHPWAWSVAVLLNAGGVAIHVLIMTYMLTYLEFAWFGSCFVLLALLLCARKARDEGRHHWAPRDAAWYPQWGSQNSTGKAHGGSETEMVRALLSQGSTEYELPSQCVPTLSTYIQMSDGRALAADIWVPCAGGQPLLETRWPTILHMTRYNRNWRLRRNSFGIKLLGSYGVDKATRLFNVRSMRYLQAFVPRGYAFVSVDVRGTGASGGSRPMDLIPRETKDYHELVRWVKAQPWCNAQVASGGISYDGMTATCLAADSNDVDAIFPLFSPMDVYEDLVFPGGLQCPGFLQAYSEFCLATENNRSVDSSIVHMDIGKQTLYSLISGGSGNCYENRPCLGSVVSGPDGGVAPVGSGGEQPLMQELAEAVREHAANHSIYKSAAPVQFKDDVLIDLPRDEGGAVTAAGLSPWNEQRLRGLRDGRASACLYAGWFDSGSVVSALRVFSILPAEKRRLVIGPWNHGCRATCSPHHPGGLTAPKFDMYSDLAMWLDWVLKGKEGPATCGAVHFYVMGEGAETWQSAPTWPPPGVHDNMCFALQPGSTLKELNSDLLEEIMVWQVDPTATTPAASRWNLVQHILQNPVLYGNRLNAQGVFYFETEPLQQALTIAGRPSLKLELSLKDGHDAAVFVYLEDVAVDRRVAHYVTEGQLRAGFAASELEGECTYRQSDLRQFRDCGTVFIRMQPVAYRFAPGHRIRIAIAGADATNFATGSSRIPGIAKTWEVRLGPTSRLVLPALPTSI